MNNNIKLLYTLPVLSKLEARNKISIPTHLQGIHFRSLTYSSSWVYRTAFHVGAPSLHLSGPLALERVVNKAQVCSMEEKCLQGKSDWPTSGPKFPFSSIIWLIVPYYLDCSLNIFKVIYILISILSCFQWNSSFQITCSSIIETVVWAITF